MAGPAMRCYFANYEVLWKWLRGSRKTLSQPRWAGEGLQKRQKRVLSVVFLKRRKGGAFLRTAMAKSASCGSPAAALPDTRRCSPPPPPPPQPPHLAPGPTPGLPAPQGPRAAGLFPALAGPHPVTSGPASCLCGRFVASWWSARARPSAEPPPRDWLVSQPSLVRANLSLALPKRTIFFF